MHCCESKDSWLALREREKQGRGFMQSDLDFGEAESIGNTAGLFLLGSLGSDIMESVTLWVSAAAGRLHRGAGRR